MVEEVVSFKLQKVLSSDASAYETSIYLQV